MSTPPSSTNSLVAIANAIKNHYLTSVLLEGPTLNWLSQFFLSSATAASSDALQLPQSFTARPLLSLTKDVLFWWFIWRRFLSRILRDLWIYGPIRFGKRTFWRTVQAFITFTRTWIPSVNAAVQKEIDKNVRTVQEGMLTEAGGVGRKYLALPAKGLDEDKTRAELIRYQQMGHVDWKGGRVSGAIYHGGDELSSLITEAFGLFTIANPLHPEVFPGVRKMESEIVSMVLRLFNAPEEGVGSVTSGGTESILMATKAYRDYGLEKRGITEPEMIVPVTIHAAFDKAAHYFGVKLISIDVDPNTGMVDLPMLARAISSNTVMIAASAPNFPHGVIDPLPILAKMAKACGIGFHIDCCLGGFLVPFMDKAGYPLPHPCDFRLDGVTSISVDTHKYGFAPKGSSVIMYSSKKWRDYQYFVITEWPGGVYASPSIAGSRPGALIAGCWAAMVHFGENGYVESTRAIIATARTIAEGISRIPHVYVIGEPLLSVVAFATKAPVKTYAVADLLSRKGWHLNVLQNPPAVHIACTLLSVPAAQDLLVDIRDAVDTLLLDPEAGNGDVAAIYGTAASVPDRTIIADVAKGFLDGLTMTS